MINILHVLHILYATDTRRVANGIIINTNDNSNG